MNKQPAKPKFILVDSSVSGSGGHYLEYAEQVFDAAQIAGFSCVLIANTAFRPDAAIDAQIFPVLPLDLWGNNLALRHDKNNVFTDDDRRFLRLHFGRTGVLWAAANNMEAVRHYAREVPLSKTAAKRLATFARLAAPIQQRYRTILAAESSDRIPSSHRDERSQRYRALRQAIREIVRQPIAGPLRPADADVGAADLYQHSARAEGYERAIENVLHRVGADADDLVFIPTLSFSEATAVRNLLARSETARMPSWCLLFRRDVYRGYTPDWEAQEWNVHALRNLFASFARLAERTRVKFLCDTEELARQYRHFQTGPFTTVAIPVRTRSAAASEGTPAGQEQTHSSKGWMEILFRRDARFVHGFDYLSQVFDTLPQELMARVRISATSAASEPPPTQDEFDSRLTRACLRPYGIDCYREIAEPQLRLDGWRSVMRLFQIAVFVEPRAARPSLFIDELDAAVSVGAIVVLPTDTAVAAAFESTLVQQHPNARAFFFSEGETSTATAMNLAAALCEAIKFCEEHISPIADDLQSWRLCYLGDAREEKGFALLPYINEHLSMKVIKGRPIRIAAQGYQTGTAVDVAMLKGVDALLRSTADGTVVVQEPLPSDEYAAMIARSDIVYNLYRRENYTARSSGVFVEAIACHKPVVATAGTWMSAVMGSYAPDYHRDMIDPGQVIADVLMTGADGRWREIGIENGKQVDREIEAGNTARLAERMGIYRVFSRPERANHIWLELAIDSPYPDICVHINFAWRGANLVNIREERVLLNRLGSGSLSAVLEVPRVCEDLWVGLNVAHSPVAVDLSWLRLRWVDVAGVAFLPGGMIVSEAPQEIMADRAVAAITTILSNYDPYRSSCEWLARRWADAQNADQLVAGLLKAPALSPQTRFAGGDW